MTLWNKIKLTIVGKMLGIILLVLCKTLRCVVINSHHIHDVRIKHSCNIFASWHGRLLFSLHYAQHRKQKWDVCALVSPSDDGELAHHVLRTFDFKTIRGDSKYKSRESLDILINKVKEGCNIALVLDGPLGPRYKAKHGAVKISSITEVPIISTIACASRTIVFKSWDLLMLPLPFSTVYYYFSPPIYVPKDADDKTIKEYNIKLEEALAKGMEIVDNLASNHKQSKKKYKASFLKHDNPSKEHYNIVVS